MLVDYLQLVSDRGHENRAREVMAVAYGLKALAKELAIPVIALAQLNRGDRRRAGRLEEVGHRWRGRRGARNRVGADGRQVGGQVDVAVAVEVARRR